MERQRGLKCAVFNAIFNLKRLELKPLFGIRDFLQQSTSQPPKDDSFEGICETHVSAKVSFD